MNRTNTFLGWAGIAALSASLPAAGAAGAADNDALRQMQQQIDALRRSNETQAKEIENLKAQNGEQWLTEQRAGQIRGVVQDVLSDSSTRSSFQSDGATAGYDKNFFIASADGNFRLNLGGQIQARFAWNYMPSKSLNDSGNDDQRQNEYGTELRRVKLNFFGHVFDPSWAYRIQFAYERDGQNSGTPLRFEDVFIQKALGDGFFVRFGQWQNIFNYEELTSSRTQQFAERSVVNQYYNTKFVQGAMLGWEGDANRIIGSYNDGGGNRDMGVVQGGGNPTEWALTVRTDWKLAGEWGQFKDMQGWRGSEFAAMFGAGVNWQRASGNTPSGRNDVGNGTIKPAVGSAKAVNTELSLLAYTADFNVRGDGWSFWTAFMGSYLYNAGMAAQSNGASSLDVDGSLSYGVVVQGGVFVADALELIARYEGLWVNSGADFSDSGGANSLNTQSLNIITLGFNYYFNKNAVKFTYDAGWAMDPVLFSTGLFGESIGGADWRSSQTGDGTGEVVMRAQMQLLF